MSDSKWRHLHERLHAGSSILLVPGAFEAISIVLWIQPSPPGAPISLTWSLHALKGTGLDAGTVTARVFHHAFNALLYTSPAVPVAAQPFGVGTGDQPALIPTPAGGLGADLSHIGSHALRLEVTSSVSGAVFTVTSDLEIVPNRAFGWLWLPAHGTPDPSAPAAPQLFFLPRYDFLINHGYKLQGQVSNSAPASAPAFTGTGVLLEREATSGQSVPVESFGFDVGPGGSWDQIFAELKKDWTWLIPGIWVRNFSEPLAKSFLYTMQLSASDDFGNFYDRERSGLELRVNVSVSDEKQAYANGALGVLAVGLIAAIFTFGAGLSAAQAIAGGLGSRALDPPEPDPRYRAKLDLNAEDRAPSGDARFEAIAVFLGWADRTNALFDALGDIQNRLLGARVMADVESEQMQRASYLEAAKALHAAALATVDAAGRAARSVQASEAFAVDALEARLRLWQRAGVPGDVRAALAGQGVAEETLRIVERAVQEPIVVRLAQDLPRALSLSALAMSTAARLLLARTGDVLGDEGRGQKG